MTATPTATADLQPGHHARRRRRRGASTVPGPGGGARRASRRGVSTEPSSQASAGSAGAFRGGRTRGSPASLSTVGRAFGTATNVWFGFRTDPAFPVPPSRPEPGRGTDARAVAGRGNGNESQVVALEHGRLDAVIAGLLFMVGDAPERDERLGGRQSTPSNRRWGAGGAALESAPGRAMVAAVSRPQWPRRLEFPPRSPFRGDRQQWTAPAAAPTEREPRRIRRRGAPSPSERLASASGA